MSPSAINFCLKLLLEIYPFLRKIALTDSGEYEYDYTALAPLAMTSVKTAWLFHFPLFRKDELPTQKWLAILVGETTIFAQPKQFTESINGLVSSETQLELINKVELINAATKQKDLNDAVLKLLSALKSKSAEEGQNISVQSKNDIQPQISQNENFEFEEELNEIDQQFENWLTENPQQESRVSLESEQTYANLREIIRLNVRSLSLNQQLTNNQTDSRETLECDNSNPTLQDYEKLVSSLSIRPATLTNFQRDDVFAYMQVAGPNPVMLNQIKEVDSRLPITNEQYQSIVSKDFQDSLQAALQEGRLYLSDYSKLENLMGGNFGGIQTYMYAPVALFAVPPDKCQNKNLLPIAIRCQKTSGNDSPIFTPLGKDNWMTAKTVLQMADSNYHELISHLGQTHLFIEPFVVATNRCFSNIHPVRLLLKPHLEGTALINYFAAHKLLAPESPLNLILGGTIDSNRLLSIKEAKSQLANFNEVALPRTLKKRGVNNNEQLPIYPYRDDGLQIWNAIYQWVDEYLRLFYSSDNSVETNPEIQSWASELFFKGYCNIGENADGHIKTLDYLVNAISTIIFSASAQHAAVNFPQSGLMTYVPAFPLACYSPAPTAPQEQQDFMGSLPPLDRAEQQISVLSLLGKVYYTKLGDYDDYRDYSDLFLNDDRVKNAVAKFKVHLNDIEKNILDQDRQRLVSYRYLLPSKIPQSINI